MDIDKQPEQGYDIGLIQGEVSKLWWWRITSKEYGTVLAQDSVGYVEKAAAERNLDLVRQAFAEEAANG